MNKYLTRGDALPEEVPGMLSSCGGQNATAFGCGATQGETQTGEGRLKIDCK